MLYAEYNRDFKENNACNMHVIDGIIFWQITRIYLNICNQIVHADFSLHLRLHYSIWFVSKLVIMIAS